MSLERTLYKRAGNKCELCGNQDQLQIHTLAPQKDQNLQKSLVSCKTCVNQIENPEGTEPNHWRCLNDSMWSEHDAVKVASWRMLSRLRAEGWPKDLLDMMYLEDDTLEFAKITGEGEADPEQLIHRDVNGVVLKTGDSVVLIKDLKVKGSSMVAKQGTAVRNIRLDHENEQYIEGKVGPTLTVIITAFVKKI